MKPTPYGYFDGNADEFVITQPQLPQPWINYLTSEKYCAIVSHTGGGYSFYQDPQNQRLLEWQPTSMYHDRPGRYLYVRDQKSSQVYSVTWQPLRVKPDEYQCRVGLGYQHIETRYGELKNTVTYVVPHDESCELWIMTIENQGAETRDLSVFGYAEWFMGSVDDTLIHHEAVMWNRAQYDEKTGGIVACKTSHFEKQRLTPFSFYCLFGSSARVDGFDCHKARFLGRFNNVASPEAILEHGQCYNSFLNGEEAVGVLQNNFFLKSGERKTIVFVLGQTQTLAEAEVLLRRYKDVSTAEKALKQTQALWKQRVIGQPLRISTPDGDLDQLYNVWFKYQAWVNHFWSRSASLYFDGLSGHGYRDACHDAEAMLLLDATAARKRLKHISTLIRRDGSCAPGWSDLFGPFGTQPTKDHAVWFVSAMHAYIMETGDLEFLNEKSTWLKDAWREAGTIQDPNWKQDASSEGHGTLWEKIKAQLHCSYHDSSVHGLSRMGMGDWNESLDFAGDEHVGESVWLSMALVWALRFAMELAQALGEEDIVETYAQWIHGLSERINRHGWDGEWYLRGYTDEGQPIGSAQNSEGKLYLNTQSWAVLSDIVPNDRIAALLKNVDQYLEVEKGYTLFYPAYTLFDATIGRIAKFSPGVKDNAGIMTHAQIFMLAANFKLDRGDSAYQVLQKSLPNTQADYDRYKSEPYVMAQFLVGPDHPYNTGMGCFSWMTASAGATLWLISQWMLGIHPELHGLHVHPVLPCAWKQCRLIRPFRNDIYEIEINNPHGVTCGVHRVTLDGQILDKPFIPFVGDGGRHQVVVTLGKTMPSS